MIHDWKSTATGILSFITVTCLTVMGFTAPYIATAPASTAALLAKIMAGCSLLTALCRAWVGLITKNADATAVAHAINDGNVNNTGESLSATPK
jgi:hypothetical protein